MAIGLKSNNFYLWTRLKISFLFGTILSVFYVVAYLSFILQALWLESTLIIALILLGYSLVRLSLKHIREGLSSQKRFISSASHELRTPLSIIKANLELALIDRSSVDKNELIATLESNLEEVDRMTDILSMLLHTEEQFSDTDRKIIMRGEIDLSHLVSKIISKSIKFAEEKKITISQDIEKPVYVLGNKEKLEGVVYGVLHNAVTYTPNHGSVSVMLKALDNQNNIKLTIIDTGIGIPKDELPHIFNPFYRAKRVEENGHSGVGGAHFGLGLSVAQKVVRDHNGSIVVKSSKKGGTEVEISLPLAVQEQSIEHEENSQKVHSF